MRNIILALTILASSPSLAQQRSVFIVGAGIGNCSAWTERKSAGPEPHVQDQQWLWGFMSGFDLFGLSVAGNVAPGMDGFALSAWMDNYCADHPTERISTAAQLLIKEMQAKSGAH